MIGEQQFFESAREFLRERFGEQAAHVDVDTELIQSGLLDSLLVLEFFFLEGVRGAAIAADAATVEELSTLRNAYRIVVAS
ncbi:hypothetical protein GAR05_01575 [Micromonospora saelicesensis]|uniref:Carrier domain-containing protein n=1 Tax=Micromonospora saelicesensis TaxID=285676 RepID=A0ABX9CNG9_9ACTN|nr:hypothetical protein [Micromonospora saelicesensis]RAO01967.1 hypothetical protein GAR05_01575 [Micromonospora saelicesensis]RAO42857.1 hypothetical protein PSN01_06109 [Micromonospora saelicesensis]RAO57091.1 hypothetical protein LUPAC06_03279 [Micromonospora saelicesensis]